MTLINCQGPAPYVPVVLERTVTELNGIPSIDLEDAALDTQQIMSSSSFGDFALPVRHQVRDSGRGRVGRFLSSVAAGHPLLEHLQQALDLGEEVLRQSGGFAQVTGPRQGFQFLGASRRGISAEG